jgi:predicted O-methyltransferase YrrM
VIDSKTRRILRDVARQRWTLPIRSGRIGKLMGRTPYVPTPGRVLIRASSRLSQGAWLVRLAETAAAQAGGRPLQVVELGTCVGISGMYLLAGMSPNGGGHLTTFEGEPQHAELAQFQLERLRRRHGLDNVTFEVRVGPFSRTVGPFFAREGPELDLVFVDGPHDEDSTLEYQRLIKPRMATRGIVVHDDIAWSDGMVRAWAKLREQERCRTMELHLGGRPSRGVLFLGEAARGGTAPCHLDGPLERMLRQARSRLRGGSR